jgi:hypothetical protein
MTFPALVPSARTYTPGDVPQVRQVALSGMDTAYRLGSRRVGQSLSLTFNNISEAQLNEIRDHYVAQDGSYNIFFLPPEVWSGYAVPPVPSPSNVAWRYGTPPTITDGSCDLWSVEIELASYVIELGDIDIDIPPGETGSDPDLPTTVDYIYDGLTASASPARAYLIDSGASA